MLKQLTCIIATLCVLSATQVFAEGFFDLYAGPSFTERANVKIISSTTETNREVSFSSELTYGVRGGYWFSKLPWMGVAGDFSSQHVRGPNAKFDITPLAPMIMFRLPLGVDEKLPQGRIQPYLGIGPSISFYTYAAANNGPPTNEISAWDINVGIQAPVGIAVQLAPHFALFGEYRYTWYDINVEPIIAWGSQARELRARLSSHNILFGVSFRY